MNEFPTVRIDDAELLWRNFEGRKGQFNNEGQHTFAVVIDPETAEQMKADRWNVKLTKPREEGEPQKYFVPVEAGYKIRPPLIVLITDRKRTPLGEDQIALLDFVDIRTVDLIIRGRIWNPEGDIKAWLQTMFITINQDPLELKYEMLEEQPSDG